MSNDSGGNEPPPPPLPSTSSTQQEEEDQAPSLSPLTEVPSSPAAAAATGSGGPVLATNVLGEGPSGVMMPSLERAAAASVVSTAAAAAPPLAVAPYGGSALVMNLASLQSSPKQQQQQPPLSRSPCSADLGGPDASKRDVVGSKAFDDANQRLILSLLGVDPDMVDAPSSEPVPVSATPAPSEEQPVDDSTADPAAVEVKVGPEWIPTRPYKDDGKAIDVSSELLYDSSSDQDLRHRGLKRLEDGSVIYNRKASGNGGEFVRCADCGKWRLRPRSSGRRGAKATTAAAAHHPYSPSSVTCSSFLGMSCDDPCDWITSQLDTVELLPLIPVQVSPSEDDEDNGDVAMAKADDNASGSIAEAAQEGGGSSRAKPEGKKSTEPATTGKRSSPAVGPKKAPTAAGKAKTTGSKAAAGGGARAGAGKIGRPRKGGTTPKLKAASAPPEPLSPSMINSWVQCDSCRRWRMISPELAKAKEGRDQIFVCSELPGKSCEDPCDWVMDNQNLLLVDSAATPSLGSPPPPARQQHQQSKGGTRRGSRQQQQQGTTGGNSSSESRTSSRGLPLATDSDPSPSGNVEVAQVSVDAVECLLDWDEPNDRYYVKWKGADVQLGDWEPATRLLEVPEEMKAVARKEGSRWSGTSVSVTDARRKRARTTMYTDMRAKRQEELIAAAARQPGEDQGPSTAPTVSPAPPKMPDMSFMPAATSIVQQQQSALTSAAASSSSSSSMDPTLRTAAAAGVTAISHTALEHPRGHARPKANSRIEQRKQAMLAAKHRQQMKVKADQQTAPAAAAAEVAIKAKQQEQQQGKEEEGKPKKEAPAPVVKAESTTAAVKSGVVKKEAEGAKGKLKGKRTLKKAAEMEGSVVGSEKGSGRRKATKGKASKTAAAKVTKKKGRGRPSKGLFSDDEDEGDTPDIDIEDAEEPGEGRIGEAKTPRKKKTRLTATAAEGGGQHSRTPAKSAAKRRGSALKDEAEEPMKLSKVAGRGQPAEVDAEVEEAPERAGKRKRQASAAGNGDSSDDEDGEEDEVTAAVKRRKKKKKHEGKKMKHKKGKKSKADRDIEAAGGKGLGSDIGEKTVTYPMPTGKVPILHHRADTFMLCVKPVGCSVDTAIAWARALIAAEEGDGACRPEEVELIAGVIDEEYSGLCLFGLSAATNGFLREQARTQTLCIGYLCVIAGRPPAPNGLLHGSLGCSYTTVATMTDDSGKMQYAVIYVNATPHEEGNLPLLPPHIKLASADTHSLLYYGLKGSGRSSLVHASRLAFYPPMANSPHTPIPIAGFEIPVPPEYAEFLRFAGDSQTNWEPLKVSLSCSRFAHVGPDHWVVGGSRQGQAASVCFPSGYCPSCFTVYPSFSSRQVCSKCSEARTLLAVPWARHVTYQQAASNLLTAQQPEHVLHNHYEINQAAALEAVKASGNGAKESDGDPSVQLRRHVITTVRLNFESRGQGFAGGVGVLISDVEAQLDAELPTWRDAVPHTSIGAAAAVTGTDTNRVGIRGLLGETEPQRRAQGIMKIYLPFESLPRLAPHPEYTFSSYAPHSQHMMAASAAGGGGQKGAGSRWQQQQQQYHHHRQPAAASKWGHYKGSAGEWGKGGGGPEWSKYKGGEWGPKKGGPAGVEWPLHRGPPTTAAATSWAAASRQPRNWSSSYEQYLHHHASDSRPTSAEAQQGPKSPVVEEEQQQPPKGDPRRPPSSSRPLERPTGTSLPSQMSPAIARAAMSAAREASWLNNRRPASPMSPAISPPSAAAVAGPSPSGIPSTEAATPATAVSAYSGIQGNAEMSPAAVSDTMPSMQQQQQALGVAMAAPQPVPVGGGAPRIPEVALTEGDVRAIVELTSLIRQRCSNHMLLSATPAAPVAPRPASGGPSSVSAEPALGDPREALRRGASAARSGGGASVRGTARSSRSRTPPARRRNDDRERNRMYYRSPDKGSRSSPRGGGRRRRRDDSDSASRSRSVVARRRRAKKSASSIGDATDSGPIGANSWGDRSGGWDHYGGGDLWPASSSSAAGGGGGGGSPGKGRSAWQRKPH